MTAVQILPVFAILVVAGLLLHVSRTVPYVDFPIEAISARDVPAPSAFAGRFQITHQITKENTRKLLHGVLQGPEHIAIAPPGFAHPNEPATASRLFTAIENGTVYSVQLSNDDVLASTLQEEIFVGPGRPLGFTWDANGGMYICNSLQGLMYWRPSEQVRIAANRVSKSSAVRAGERLTLVNSVAVSQRDGRVYFTSSTDVPPPYINGTYLPMKSVQLATMLGRQTGLLLEFDPQTQQTRCLEAGLWFANGVALPKDGTFVLFVDTMRMSILKHWLHGAKAGKTEVLFQQLPAFPDNLNWSPDTDTFWVGFVARPSPALKTSALLRNSIFRGLVARLPEAVLDKMAKKVSGGMEFDGAGNILKVVVDPLGRFTDSTPSGLLLNGGRSLLMGNLHNDYFALSHLR